MYDEQITLRNSSFSWENELKRCTSSIESLKSHMLIKTDEEEDLQRVIDSHPMLITRYYLSLIDWDNPDDPVRRMIVPDTEELNMEGSYDTSGERESTKMPGLQHKYKQDALILSTNRCAAYCRYCFRKRLVGLPNEEVLSRFNDAVEYIREHREINNVLISGGDPFVLPTEIIEKFLEELSDIDHIDFIRFGTRTPVTFPGRITSDYRLRNLLRTYSRSHKRIYVVTQFNHLQEITEKSIAAVDALIRSGVIVNNQSVLLKGVNDDPECLGALFNRLVGIGVNPYYLFQCRPVKRVKHHFQVPLSRGYEIVEEAKKLCNGHSKRFKFIMSHNSGKIEILGIMDGMIYLKYHQARNPEDIGRMFSLKINDTAAWLDDLG